MICTSSILEYFDLIGLKTRVVYTRFFLLLFLFFSFSKIVVDTAFL